MGACAVGQNIILGDRFTTAVFRIRISFHADPDPDPGFLKCPYGSRSGSRPLIFYLDPEPDLKGVKIKEENLNRYQQIFNIVFQKDIKTPLNIRKHNVRYYKRILTFMFPVLYSPNETVYFDYFLGFFTSWIQIQEAYLYAESCGSGSETLHYRYQ